MITRSISYGNETHPATLKRTLVVPVSKLPLNSSTAVHGFILLAGVRWSTAPPKDSGLSAATENDPWGYIKISCEMFPRADMNLKWTVDVLDKLIRTANVSLALTIQLGALIL
jgi:small subunit ribosomal protein S35